MLPHKLQEVLTDISRLVTTTLFKIEDSSISVISILLLIIGVLVVIFLTRRLGKWLRRSLLVKLGFDEGSIEALAIIISYSAGLLGFAIALQVSGFSLNSLFATPLFTIEKTAISLGSICTLIFWVVVVILISRVFGNWLKRSLLVKLGLDAGSREAIATIVTYSTGTLSLVLVLQASGIDFNSLTFLAGGFGIGLGFAVQDLAKNFVSGLTLLLEQPMKIGDFIQLDDLSGIVHKISIRSTTIRTGEGISIIVPNLNFVTNKIINWNHQDPRSCITIPIGVAYESDPALVAEILLGAAYTEHRVLSDPSPEVQLRKFDGDSLDMELYVWITDPTAASSIISSLNFVIQHELRERDIKTPSRQRDLWFRNPEDLREVFRQINLANGSGQSGKEAIAPEQFQKPSDGQAFSPEQFQKPAEKAPKPLALRDLLRKVSYFENFTDLEMLRLIEKGYRQLMNSQKFVFREDDPGDSFHIILSGSVEIIAEKTNKQLRILYAGDFFGELALLMGIPRTASVRTLENTTLFVVSRNGFQKLLASYPRLGDQIAEKLVERKQELIQRQQMLRELGLLDETDLENNPMVWIRNRMKTLFGV